jgi:hypothetical protein
VAVAAVSPSRKRCYCTSRMSAGPAQAPSVIASCVSAIWLLGRSRIVVGICRRDRRSAFMSRPNGSALGRWRWLAARATMTSGGLKSFWSGRMVTVFAS